MPRRTTKKTTTKSRAKPSPDTAGQKLARLRLERGLTQQELARRMGVDQSVISNYERGTRRLHGDVIVRLAQFLGARPDQLLGFAVSDAREITVRRRFLKRLEDVDRLTEREQRALLQTIDAFIERARLKEGSAAG